MQKLGALALIVATVACGRSSHEQASRFVATIEVPLRSTKDRADLIALFRGVATANRLHVDDASEGWRSFPDDTRKTIYVGAWRGEGDDDLEVSIDDGGHLGRAWVSFTNEGQADLPALERERALAQIRQRWPDAQLIPILPSGGLPLASDLRLTPSGYKIAADAAQNYELPPTSPIVEPG